MNCESKRISELPGVTRVYPNDLIPIVQDGTNKYITAKDLLGCHDHSGDDCCCSQALSKAITALDFSRTAMDLANKAYDKACLVGTKLAALEEKVAEHDTLICNIRSLITLIFNKFEELEGNLKVTIQLSIDEQNKKYKVLQGTREVETILVPRPTTDFENGDGRPADAAEVLRRLRSLKGEVSKNLNFVAGKFTLNGENYNGTTEKTLNIPTRTSHLINDGDPDGNPFLTGVKGYDGRTAPVTDGIADLSRIPIKLDDLNDVDAATPQAGDILYYDGTKWVNTPLQDLVESIIDCDYIQNCVSNFKVTPKTHNKTATETTAEYTVEATGAWTVAKESGDFITNFTPSGNGNGIITVTFGNNTTSSTRTAQFLVTEIATGRLVRVTINQSGVTPTVNRTITYNISGGLTNSIKVDNETITTTGTLTASDGSNYSVPIVSNESGYRIASVTPSVGTYSNGTLTINPITSDVTVLVVLEEIPAGTHNVTYVVDGDATKITNLPNSPVTITNGLSYTFTPTVETGYEIPNNGVTFNPSNNGDYTNGTITIPNSITSDTTITIKVLESSTEVWLDNINLGANGNLFNAFGVIEERFNANSSVAIDPAVSDPYDASTYTNGAATYDVNLGQGPSTDINYLKDHLYLRLQVVTGNEDGADTSLYRETKLSDFDSSYELKPSGSNYRYPFTADISLDGNNNIILSIGCLPTDFADSDSTVITNTDNSTYSSLEVKGSYVVRELTLELMDDNGNIIDQTPSWDTNFSREIYCNKLFSSESNNCYGISGYVTSSDTFLITSGYYQNNLDSTSDRTTPLAAWEVSNGKLGHSAVISPATSSETAEITKTGDIQVLGFTNLQDKLIYDLSVTTNSTNSSDYSSLTSEQLHWIYLSNIVFRMNFSSNISDFVNTSNSWLFTGSIKGRYPTAWGGGNRRSLTYLSVNTTLTCEIDPLFSTSLGEDKYSQIVIEDLSALVASSGISITLIDLLGNTILGDVIDLTDPNDSHYGDTYDLVINEYCSDSLGHGCTSFAIVYINSNNERHISIQFLGVVSDVSVTLNS